MGVKVLENCDIEFRGKSNDILNSMNKEQADLIKEVAAAFYDWGHTKEIKKKIESDRSIKFKEVIFNGPATIIYWKDGTKTVVKCTEGDTYNPEVGIAMATLKKIFGESYPKYRQCVSEAVNEHKEREKKKKLDKYVKELVDAVKEMEATDEPET